MGRSVIQRTLSSLRPESLAAPGWWRRPFAIDEPDVTLTDVGLALEAATFAVVLARTPTHRSRLRQWSISLFSAAAVASIAGAADHGFLRREGRKRGRDVLRVTTLLALGASAVTLVALGAEIGLPRAAARRLIAFTTVAATAYGLIVLVGPRDFVIAILAYVPSALFLLWILCQRYARQGDRGSLLGIAAVLLALVAAAVQRLEIGVHPRYLGHNALYHVIQAASFALFFVAARDLLRASASHVR
jgi:hypothetical protein